jgi:hypothetical protein
MAMTPEGKVKKAVKEYLRARGVWFCIPMGTGFGKSGVPDFLCCKNGIFFAIETKAPGKRNNTTEMQKMQIAAICAAGGRALVIDNVEQLIGIV